MWIDASRLLLSSAILPSLLIGAASRALFKLISAYIPKNSVQRTIRKKLKADHDVTWRCSRMARLSQNEGFRVQEGKLRRKWTAKYNLRRNVSLQFLDPRYFPWELRPTWDLAKTSLNSGGVGLLYLIFPVEISFNLSWFQVSSCPFCWSDIFLMASRRAASTPFPGWLRRFTTLFSFTLPTFCAISLPIGDYSGLPDLNLATELPSRLVCRPGPRFAGLRDFLPLVSSLRA